MPSWPNNESSDDDEYMSKFSSMHMEYFDGVNCGVVQWVDAPMMTNSAKDGMKSHGMDYTSQEINELKDKKMQLEEQTKIEIQMEKLKLRKEQRCILETQVDIQNTRKAMKEIEVDKDLLKEEKKKME
ncbi:hypothetical protein D1007_41152 [Hordeum vulgare]|nr:hypothetical protein D1007_41152 [Hordeum vulgare]KAI5004761.1 hypothetical protein ZWY2020_032004 [Hordeum vulgare]